MKLAPGSVLAERYRLVRRLGEGGMGEVWQATHVVTQRPVAVKLLLRALDSHPTGQARARFVLEAQTACAVDHPNVVEILDFRESEAEPPVIVMELLHGETLASRLSREGALSLEETAAVLLPVVSAVGTAHCRGIVHRDLKPANVFLSRSGESELVVKVLDFGIAKWLVPQAGESALRTQTGSTLGTPCYMAPEQAVGDRTVDHRVDIWSLGVMFYECLSGGRPVEGENAAHMVMRLLSTGIIPIGQLVPKLPQNLAELIGRMLSREPAQRPRDLREVFAALAPLVRASVPAFGEPQVQPVSRTIPPRKFAELSAPPVSWGAKTPLAPVSAGGEVGERARSGRLRGRRSLGARVVLVGGTAATVVALAATHWLHAGRPNPAGTWATQVAAREEPAITLAAPEPPTQGARGPAAQSPAVEASDSARVDVPAAPARSSPVWARAAPTPRALASTDAASSSSEPTKPAPATSASPLDIQLLQ
ncbi:MAG: protein kinase [Myxococcota bacterium]|nr:protein kinase [Myxococcota bacterium]